MKTNKKLNENRQKKYHIFVRAESKLGNKRPTTTETHMVIGDSADSGQTSHWNLKQMMHMFRHVHGVFAATRMQSKTNDNFKFARNGWFMAH